MNIEILFRDIVPAHALQFSVLNYAAGRLELAAPLEPNLNDKGTGFAGSISSMLVLSGWGAITLRLQEAGVDAEVMVVKSETEYCAPVRSDLRAEAELNKADAQAMFQALEDRKRGRVRIESRLYSNGTLCATMTAHYAVLAAAR